MLVRMINGKDLYYPGELVDISEEYAQKWIAAGVAQPATCPDCGAQLQDAGCRAYCDNCGYKQSLRW